MKALDRFLLFLLILVLLAVCAGAVYIMIEPSYSSELVENFIYNVEHMWTMKLVIGFATLLILLVSIKVLFSRSGNSQTTREPKQIIISADGNVRITADTVSDIVVQASRKLVEIRDAKCSLDQDEQGLNVVLTVYVTGEESIPDIAARTTDLVRETMEDICGIIPANIRILAEKAPVVNANIPVVR